MKGVWRGDRGKEYGRGPSENDAKKRWLHPYHSAFAPTPEAVPSNFCVLFSSRALGAKPEPLLDNPSLTAFKQTTAQFLPLIVAI